MILSIHIQSVKEKYLQQTFSRLIYSVDWRFPHGKTRGKSLQQAHNYNLTLGNV